MALKAGRYGVTKEMLAFLDEGGGGGVEGKYKIVEDDITVSSTESTVVELGFKPDFLILASKKTNNYSVVMYSPNFLGVDKQYRSYIYGSYAGSAIFTLPYSGTDTNCLADVTDTGFSIYKWDVINYTVDSKIHYIALKILVD